MIRTKNIRWITKYFLLVLIIFHLSFAQDEIVQRSGDDHKFLELSASSRPNSWEDTRAPVNQQRSSPITEGQTYKIVFFIILGIGLAIFVSLLFVCNKVARHFEDTNTSSVPGTTAYPPNSRGTYNIRMPDEIGIRVSYVNSAYSSGPMGRSEVDRSASDRPPDYSTVANNDTVSRNRVFPQVVNTHLETPPPKYEDGAPAFH